MIVGFTGTRKEPTKEQKDTLRRLLCEIPAGGALHHGDCVGADAYAHGEAQYLGYVVVVHPPVDETHRAGCQPLAGGRILEPLTHFARNRAIVQHCDRLIAAPCDMTEQPKGGTWYTVRYARKFGKPVTIVWPDGSVTT